MPNAAASQPPTYDVTTIGEIMLRLSTPPGTRLETAYQLDIHPGGAESNVVSLLARLGRRTAWAGALPRNALGNLAANHLRMAGVDLRAVHWCETGRMGAYYVEFSAPPRPIQVIYDRAHSCTAQMMPADVKWQPLLDTRLQHLTGITPALSPSCREIVEECVARAGRADIPLSLDINYRQKLWPPAEAAAVLKPLLRRADLLFCGHGDAQRLFACAGDPPTALRQLADLSGAATVVMSIGDAGALALQNDTVLEVQAVPVAVVDRLGAGDALAAGVIHGWLAGDLARGLRTGVLLAALALSQHGDMVITTPDEVEALLGSAAGVIVR